MNENVAALLIGLIATAITAVITYLATVYKTRLDLSAEYDKELRANREAAYKDLWKRFKPLARYSVEQPVTYQIVKETSESLRDWYFDIGGIYLSAKSRKPYFDLKKAMQAILDDPELQQNVSGVLHSSVIQPLLDQGTTLRASLSDDIGSRRKPFV